MKPRQPPNLEPAIRAARQAARLAREVDRELSTEKDWAPALYALCAYRKLEDAVSLLERLRPMLNQEHRK